MKHPWLVLSCAAALGVGLACLEMSSGTALGGDPSPQTAPVLFKPLSQPSATQSVASDGDVEEVALGQAYESQSAGVSFKPPADCRLIDTESSKYIAEWADPERQWTLKLGKMLLDSPTPLRSRLDNFNKPVEGVLDKTIRNLKASLPGSKILRQDVTNTRDGGIVDPKHPESRDNVGLIAIRYTTNAKRKLSQQAIIQSSDGVYYLLTLTTPGSEAPNANDDGAPIDKGERIAVETFDRMIDTIRLLDRSAIKADQVSRLYNSRAAFVNWTASKIHSVLLDKQWVRIIKNGQDVGYIFITEGQAGAIPRPLHLTELKQGKKEADVEVAGDGLLIGLSARMLTTGTRSNKTPGTLQTDSASWFFVSADKKHEDFSRVVVTDDHVATKKGYLQEFGVSEKRVRRFFEKPPIDPNDAGVIQADRAPIPVMREDWELDVTQTTGVGMSEPLTRKLPPWYIPQALAHLLPRLLPLQKPQGYLFATYIGDAREVVMRYVDVLPDQKVFFPGQWVQAVPIHDRLGLEGSITTHYMTVDGVYLGSENKEQKLLMLPTDETTLRQIWKDANLNRPGGVNRPGPANATATPPHP